jgi:uncharacterized protein
MIVSQLCIYPIKSCQGIKLQQADITPKGFAWDRELMLVDRKGRFLTQRQYPNFAKIQVQISEHEIFLSTKDNSIAPFSCSHNWKGKEIDVEIWGDLTRAINLGDAVADWFHQALTLQPQMQCRLVRQSPLYPRETNRKATLTSKEVVSFADSSPFLITATASLAELNQRIRETYPGQGQEVPMNRFRPNIVIETEKPFQEGDWKVIQIGDVIFDVAKPCSHCIMTTIDQYTGEKNVHREPLRTLGTFRQFGDRGVMFGENLTPRNLGTIFVGDRLQVLEVREKERIVVPVYY